MAAATENTIMLGREAVLSLFHFDQMTALKGLLRARTKESRRVTSIRVTSCRYRRVGG